MDRSGLTVSRSAIGERMPARPLRDTASAIRPTALATT